MAAMVVTTVGCNTSAPRQTRFMQSKDVTVSAEELRIRVRALAMPFSGIMEEAADEFVAANDDPEWFRRALMWKINGIPAMQRALFVQDPLAALLDTWVLLAQMRVFFESGPGSNADRLGRDHALRAVDRMEDQIESLALSISATGEVDHVKELVYKIASEQAVKETFATRATTSAELAEFTAETNPGIGSAVGALTTGLGDVWSRMDVYTVFLPKQARWQAEYMVLELAAGTDPKEIVESISNITDSIDRIATTVEVAPGLLSEEREIVLRTLQEERIIALRTLQEELKTAYEFINNERIATFSESLAAERKAMLEALTVERIATMEAIRDERIAAMKDLDAIVGGLAEESMIRIVDRLFIRLLILIAILIVGGAIIAYIVARTISRRRDLTS
jgi:hypothetical protein